MLGGIRSAVLSALKDAFLHSPLVDVYIKFFRDGKNVDEDHLVTTLDNGMPIIVNRRDRCVCWFVRITGHWDSNEARALHAIVKSGFRVIEVGANFGVHTLSMAGLVGAQGRIYAFEANPAVAKHLQQSVEMNNLSSVATVFAKAAGDVPGRAYLDVNQANIGGGHLVPDVSLTSVETQIVRLDDVIEDDHIDLLKIDAEGFEFKILQGAKAIIGRNLAHISLMMEWAPSLLKDQGTSQESIIDFLGGHGFSLWRVGSKKNGEPPLVSLTYSELSNLEVGDIVASRTPLTA